jgi:hypothetical protein
MKWALMLSTPTKPLLRLMGSSHTAVHTDTGASLNAVELPAANGYAPVSLSDQTQWVFTVQPSGVLVAYPAVTWTFTAALQVYGYYLTDGGGTVSLWAETFGAPYVYPAGGGVFQLQAQATLTSPP